MEYAPPFKGSHDTAADAQELLEQEGIPYLLCYCANGLLRVETTFPCTDRFEDGVPEERAEVDVMIKVRHRLTQFIDKFVEERLDPEQYREYIADVFIAPDELESSDDEEEESWKKGE